jgi:Family of unknown function (DUF6174)
MNRLVTSAALGLILLFASSCSHAGAPGVDKTGADVAQTQRARWEAANVKDYTWSVFLSCMACAGPQPWRTTVQDGKPVKFVGTDENGNSVPQSIEKDEQNGSVPLTVEDLFDVLDDAYARQAQTVDVIYDPQLGYPTKINIDPNYGCQGPLPDGKFCTVSDDEMGYSVKSLDPS